MGEIGYRDVPPDPSIAEAVGRHHTLSTAVTDLVDNSLDAGASRVHIRFLSRNGQVSGLRVIDDGGGMDARGIDSAMTFARKRHYGSGDLGHFGLGLKAASISQADVLDVFSRSTGSGPVGRRISARQPTRVAELAPAQVEAALDERGSQLPGGPSASGTVIQWRGVRTFLSSSDETERTSWLAQTIEALRMHLGLVLHRILEAGRAVVTVDEFDLALGEAGSARSIAPINPFGFSRSSVDDPFELTGNLDGITVQLIGHVWPSSQSGSPSFRLFGRPGDEHQGLFVYRHDRLLQAGGWNGIVLGGRDFAQARVVLDLDDRLSSHAAINPEKSGVEFDPDLRRAIEHATDARGRGLRDFLAAAEEEALRSRRRNRRPITLVEPRRGFSPPMLDAIATGATFSAHEPVEIRWKTLRSGASVEVDLESRTLWINSRYRRALGADTGDADDAPLVKMLLLLLYSRFFEGVVLGTREKEELLVWDELIVAALDEELERREYGGGPTDG